MADGLTHDFKFQIGDGGQFIEGDIEFNTDGKISYKITSWSEPVKDTTLQRFSEVAELMRQIFHEFGGLKLIKFKLK